MKKFLATILICTIVFLTLNVSVTATAFSDFNSTHWAYDDVIKMVNKGIVTGYPDGTFGPENNVTRGEFCTMLIKAANLYADTGLQGNHWAYPYMQSMKQATWTYEDWYLQDDTNLNTVINRSEAAMGLRDVYLGYPQSLIHKMGEVNDYLKSTYADSSNIGGFAEAIYTVSTANLMNGYEDGCFHPEYQLTRAELCTILNRAFPGSGVNAPVSNTTSTPEAKLLREDIEITLKPGGDSVIFVNNSSAPYKFSVISINEGLIMHPYNSDNDVIIMSGETKLVDWYYDGIFNKRGADNGLNSYGYVVIEWNGKQYYADFTANGITTFYRGNARGPVAE